MEEVLSTAVAIFFVVSYFASIVLLLMYSDKYWSWATSRYYAWEYKPKMSWLYTFIGSATWFVLLSVIILYLRIQNQETIELVAQ